MKAHAISCLVVAVAAVVAGAHIDSQPTTTPAAVPTGAVANRAPLPREPFIFCRWAR